MPELLPVPIHREPASLPDRLQRYSRYVALVAEQLEAAEQGDLARLQLIEAERLEIERNWDDDNIPPPGEFGSLLHSALRELQNRSGAEERERWDLIQNGALQAAHTLRMPPLRIGSYRPLQSTDQKVDLKF
jgi:hypothetical protein